MKPFLNSAILIFINSFAALLMLQGCNKKMQEVFTPIEPAAVGTDISEMRVAYNFDYHTVDAFNLNVSAILDNGQGVAGVSFDVFDDNPQINSEAILLASGVTDQGGYYNEIVTLPLSITTIYVRPQYLGFIDVVKGNVSNKSISINLNPSKCVDLGSQRVSNNRIGNIQATYSYLGTWNSLGVPNYLLANNDVVDASFLSDVNAALPEQSQLPNVHPEYINQSNETDLVLRDSADVWVTFVHEGAGWKNALGYYSYDLANPPTSKSQITNHTIIFPNVSYQGSGGGLISGNKVKIGTFSKNTGIGWFLVANGWNGTGVGNGSYIQYSNPDFNLETVQSLRSHMVLLNSVSRNRILIGFEDMGRQSGADNDFNDALFYATANPYTSIVFNNVVALPSSQINNDIDNDGVYNTYDLYPNDPSKAYNGYFPSINKFGSLCFEDLWPSKGDFDFNDMVVNYNFTQIMDAKNDVVEIKAKFLVKAVGASYRNGFGFEIPISSSLISSITGQRLSGGIINLNGNNTEANQTNATVIVFDNPEALIHRNNGTYFNTEPSSSLALSDTVYINIVFTSPVSTNNLGAIPFNPFIFINQDRGIEVHLPDFKPTTLANQNLFGQADDNSIPSTNRYYKTSNNLPFALNIPDAFDYPVEKAQITNAHYRFKNWAESFGYSYTDWYKNITGYRNNGNVYKK